MTSWDDISRFHPDDAQYLPMPDVLAGLRALGGGEDYPERVLRAALWAEIARRTEPRFDVRMFASPRFLETYWFYLQQTVGALRSELETTAWKWIERIKNEAFPCRHRGTPRKETAHEVRRDQPLRELFAALKRSLRTGDNVMPRSLLELEELGSELRAETPFDSVDNYLLWEKRVAAECENAFRKRLEEERAELAARPKTLRIDAVAAKWVLEVAERNHRPMSHSLEASLKAACDRGEEAVNGIPYVPPEFRSSTSRKKRKRSVTARRQRIRRGTARR